MRDPTIIQLPTGESFGSTGLETPEEAAQRLRRDGWLVQRIGNVVRIVRRIGGQVNLGKTEAS